MTFSGNTQTGSGLRGGATGSSQLKNKLPRGYKSGYLQQFNPEQMEVFNSLSPHLNQGSYLQRLAGGDESTFAQMEAPANRQFQQTMGEMGSRFSGMGLGARKGSGFNIAGTTAAQEFAENIASQRQQLQRQALNDLFGLSQSFLSQRPRENFLVNKAPSFWEGLAGAVPGAVGGSIGAYFGGPQGAMAGAKIGNSFGQSLMG